MSTNPKDALTVVFVTDMFKDTRNGVVTSARRMRKQLEKQGHTVRVVALDRNVTWRTKRHGYLKEVKKKDENFFPVQERQIPIVRHFSERQYFQFAKADKKVFEKAFDGADVVHVFMPWQLEKKAVKFADKNGIPVTGAFHIQPENITYNVSRTVFGTNYMSHSLYRWLYRTFYRRIPYIHCPSEFIRSQLEMNGYGETAKLFVISNGVGGNFKPPLLPRQQYPEEKSTFDILMVGRLAPEKNQKTLIDAIPYSKYSNDIRLFFAGSGADQEMLEQRGSSLNRPPSFEYYEHRDLIRLMQNCDLYVHTATIEIEAVACLEAMATGLVPVIANSEKSATRQFALDNRCLFETENPRDLARKIDYWIEHPAERQEMSNDYAQSAEQYRMKASGKKMEKMFYEAISSYYKRPPRRGVFSRRMR